MDLELTFRLATPSDFDEILQFSERMNEGHNYLLIRFRAWMKMDKFPEIMLAYYEDKVVALLTCSVVDDGRTAIPRGAQTLPEFRGRGIFKRLAKEMTDFMRRQYPRVCKIRFTSYDQIPSMTKLVELDILSSYAKQNNLPSYHLSTTSDPIEIEACTKEYLCDVIFCNSEAQKLFPHNVLVLDFFPIEPLRSNIDFMQQERDLYFAIEKCTDGSFPRSVSFGTLSPAVKTVYWNVTVYTSDPVLYEAHILHQFKRACETIKGDFIFASYHDKSLTNQGRILLVERLHLEIDEKVSNQTLILNETENLQRFSPA